MNQEQFETLINLLALALGIENLQENREQSRHNDVEAANQRQADYLLGEINVRFEEQNRLLQQILESLNSLENG